MSDPIETLRAKFPDAKANGKGWTARCPAHDDGTASLSIACGDDGRALLNCHAGCATEAVLAALGLTMADLFADDRRKRGGRGIRTSREHAATVQPSAGLTLAAYADAKGLPVPFLAGLGLRDVPLSDGPAVGIPYRNAAGSEVAARFRCAVAGPGRFRWRKGSKVRPYGMDRLAAARAAGAVAIVEGESDAQTLWFHDVPALGLPGASTWNEDRDAPLLDGIATIYVVVEPDKGGETVRKWLAASRIRDRVRLVQLGEAKDPSGLYLRDRAGFRAAWAAALAASVAWRDAEAAENFAKRAEAWTACAELAAAPRILDLVGETVRALGVVGEDRIVRLVYLVVISRFLDKIASLAVKGASSAGKSHAVEQVLRLFPDDATHRMTSMSERALVYSDEPLSHRVLVVYEAAGLAGDLAPMFMRCLLSEGRNEYDTVEKTPEGLRNRRIVREGPTGLIVTTTAVRLHPENETRLFSVTATDTTEQTRRVLAALAAPRGAEPDLAAFHALQRWLALPEHRVEVPFGLRLADAVSPVAVRLRRDFGRVLCLIRAHAMLHQATRGRDAEGRIVATLDDYAAVRGLVGDLIAEGVAASVPATVRETVGIVAEIAETAGGGAPVTVSAVAKRLGIDLSAASRRVREGIERGLLRNDEPSPGRPARVILGEALPDDSSILPDPSRLAAEDFDGPPAAAAGGAE